MRDDAEEIQMLMDLLKDKNAVEWVMDFARMTQVWDDLIDKDVTTSDEQINRTFMNLLLKMPANPFYLAFQGALTTLMYSVILDWLTSNELAGAGEMETRIAFIIRDSMAGMIVQVSAMLHGHDYAMQHAAEVRRYFHDDGYEGFVEEHSHGH